MFPQYVKALIQIIMIVVGVLIFGIYIPLLLIQPIM